MNQIAFCLGTAAPDDDASGFRGTRYRFASFETPSGASWPPLLLSPISAL